MKKIIFRLTLLYIVVCVLTFSSLIYSNFSTDTNFASATEIRYNDDHYTNSNEENAYWVSFNYHRKEVQTYAIPFVPYYYNTNNNLSNTCASVAGSNIIGFYTLYYNNLMDGYIPARFSGGVYKYNACTSNVKIQDTINELYVKMKTNISGAGTTENEFIGGMTSYVNARGKNISFQDYIHNNIIDYAGMKNQLQLNRVFVAFLQQYNFVTQLNDTGKNLSYYRQEFSSNHIVMVFGYSITNYYDVSGMLIKTISSLNIVNGIDNTTSRTILDASVGLNKLKLITIS